MTTTTLAEHWEKTRTPGRCLDCGLSAVGRRCFDCHVKSTRKPLDPCIDCKAPVHRRSLPRADREEGSRFYGSNGRCAACDRIHRTGTSAVGMKPCADCGKSCRGERCQACAITHRNSLNTLTAEHARKMREQRVVLPLAAKYPVPTPSDDRSPLTEDERDQAVCAQVDSEIFFAELGEGYYDAKKVCARCPIAARCLAANLKEDYGVYGCSSPPERKRLRRELARATEVGTEAVA